MLCLLWIFLNWTARDERNTIHQAKFSVRLTTTHSLTSKKEESPVCVACDTIITIKHILIECADLVEAENKYFQERSLYSLFRNFNPETIIDFFGEIGAFYEL